MFNYRFFFFFGTNSNVVSRQRYKTLQTFLGLGRLLRHNFSPLKILIKHLKLSCKHFTFLCLFYLFYTYLLGFSYVSGPLLSAAGTLMNKKQLKPVKTGVENFGVYVSKFIHYGKHFMGENKNQVSWSRGMK